MWQLMVQQKNIISKCNFGLLLSTAIFIYQNELIFGQTKFITMSQSSLWYIVIFGLVHKKGHTGPHKFLLLLKIYIFGTIFLISLDFALVKQITCKTSVHVHKKWYIGSLKLFSCRKLSYFGHYFPCFTRFRTYGALILHIQ